MRRMDKKRKKRSRMGRPPMGKNARNINIAIRVSANELAAWRRAAKAAGVSLGEYLLAPRRSELKEGK